MGPQNQYRYKAIHETDTAALLLDNILYKEYCPEYGILLQGQKHQQVFRLEI